MLKGYTTEDKIKDFIGVTSLDERVTDDYIAAAEKYIEEQTGRIFIADSEDDERLFDGDGNNEIDIDDAVSISKVEIAGDNYGGSYTEVPLGGASGYILLPRNYDKRNLPISSILMRNNYTARGLQNVKITGKWGYSADVPDDIAFVATVFAAGMYNVYRTTVTSAIKSESIGNYSVTYADVGGTKGWGDFEAAKKILAGYRKMII